MPVVSLPAQHPQRASLHNEIHARPPESIAAPTALTHLVMVCDSAQREASRQHLAALLRDHHRSVPDEHTTHVRVDVGGFRLRWELHTEFVSWTFQVPLPSDVLLDTRSPPTAAEEVPQAWLAALPGHSLACIHLWIVQTAQCGPGGLAQVVEHMLNTDTLAGSLVHRGQTQVCTDFAIHADGCSRMLVQPGPEISAPRLGRLVQRLLEMETYRMMALLAMPAARHAVAVLGKAEQELAELAQAIRQADRQSEPALLDRLTRLAGQQRRHGHIAGTLAQGHPVLQKDGHTNGRNQRHQARAAAQGLVGHLLNGKTVQTGNEDGNDQHEANHHPNRQAALRAHGREGHQTHVATDHVNLTVSEVDHADDAVNHGIANGNQGVNGPQ